MASREQLDLEDLVDDVLLVASRIVHMQGKVGNLNIIGKTGLKINLRKTVVMKYIGTF